MSHLSAIPTCMVLSILGAACADKSAGTRSPAGSGTDRCPIAVDKLFAMMERLGHDVDPDAREAALVACRKKPDDPTAACIVAASDDAAIERCLAPKPKGEPLDQLARATESMRTYYFVHETFTTENVPLTPAKPCCQFPTKKCPPETAPNQVLTELLELDLSTEREFQYRFQSADDRAVIEAVGDRDCDGKTITYRRELEQRADGNMHITVLDPRAGDD
jgi:hypothetical protein